MRLTDDDISMVVRDSLLPGNNNNALARDASITLGVQEDLLPTLDDLCTRRPEDRVEREVVEALVARGFPVSLVLEDVKHLILLRDPESISRTITDVVC